jgi:hypothetical protein
VDQLLAPGLRAKVERWPEFRMGVHRVVVVLRDGREIREVFVSAGRIVGVGTPPGGPESIAFRADEIADVADDSGW